jgi:hypothetical protein
MKLLLVRNLEEMLLLEAGKGDLGLVEAVNYLDSYLSRYFLAVLVEFDALVAPAVI